MDKRFQTCPRCFPGVEMQSGTFQAFKSNPCPPSDPGFGDFNDPGGEVANSVPKEMIHLWTRDV